MLKVLTIWTGNRDSPNKCTFQFFYQKRDSLEFIILRANLLARNFSVSVGLNIPQKAQECYEKNAVKVYYKIEQIELTLIRFDHFYLISISSMKKFKANPMIIVSKWPFLDITTRKLVKFSIFNR